MRGLIKIFGLILPRGGGARFESNIRLRIAQQAELGLVIEACWRHGAQSSIKSMRSNARWFGARRPRVCAIR
jgi:hypothetical protein